MTTRKVIRRYNSDFGTSQNFKSFLDNRSTAQDVESASNSSIVKKRHTYRPRNGKSKRIGKRPTSIWTESDTEDPTTDDDNAVICIDDKENDERFQRATSSQPILKSTMVDDVEKENASSIEPPANESSQSTATAEPNINEIIDELIGETLSQPIDDNVARADTHFDSRIMPRKLSAIFETSAEANATKMSPEQIIDKSPIIERMVQNHYKQVLNATPPMNRPILFSDDDETTVREPSKSSKRKHPAEKEKKKTNRKKKNADEVHVAAEVEPIENVAVEPSPPKPKRRGRKKADVVAEVEPIEIVAVAPSPPKPAKRRGKKKIEENAVATESVEDVAVASDDTTKPTKKRGRAEKTVAESVAVETQPLKDAPKERRNAKKAETGRVTENAI